MTLHELLRGLPASLPPGATDPEVRGVRHDSRRVEPGDLYVALVGQKFDGRSFLPEAAARGAVAALGAGPAPAGAPLPWVEAAEPRALLAPLAARVYGHPDRELKLVGVTGTNGKSTVATLVTAMFERAGRPAGFIGTLGYRFGGRDFGGERTTPEASDFYALLRTMRTAGAEAVAMEVSSHALAQGRVAGAQFQVAVFTNLTRDHFDYHPDFEHYYCTKRQLFSMLAPGGKAVLNRDDAYGRRLIEELRGEVPILTFGEGGDVHLARVELARSGSRGEISTPRGRLSFSTPLLGRYNLANALAAVAAAEALELPHAAIAETLAAQQPLPGRLEPVDRGQSFSVLIDYAHTDAALAAALSSLKELSGKKVILVFGCGGDRDPGKRPLMGRVAGELADLPIATSDNPRSEDPLAILEAVEEGLKASGNRAYRIVPDRREAIRLAIELADADCAVLVAGKGHEQVQIFRDGRVPFSDYQEILAALEARLGHAAHR
ncbi:MAG: UDP-N-acetylmuramoyl-L-alanyl-D-glutamate--2,6-diaminopimelate ligase [Thermoanaerobaculia bacterium]